MKRNMKNKKYVVRFWENGKMMEQRCEVPNVHEVIKIYGLEEPDIDSYMIYQEGNDIRPDKCLAQKTVCSQGK